MRVMYVMKRSY